MNENRTFNTNLYIFNLFVFQIYDKWGLTKIKLILQSFQTTRENI